MIWSALYHRATDEALADLTDGPKLDVGIGKNIIFTPQRPKKTGLIFYPGGKVDEKAYAYIGQEIASYGYMTVIAKMPFRLVVLDPNAAENIINSFPEIEM